METAEIACERCNGCISSTIVFKFGMKVQYGKAKLPIDFCVGGDIIAMVTRVFVETAEIVL